MTKILVTGINGFVGKHLAKELAARDHHVVGVGREDLDETIVDHVAEYYTADLTDDEQVSSIPLDGLDGVISLAGLASVGPSYDNPELYQRVNVEVLAKLGRRLVKEGLTPRVIAVSTGAVYDPNQPLPLAEESFVVKNGSPYALSKLAMEEEARSLDSQGLPTIVARPFNHIGPGQESQFLVPDLYEKIISAKSNGGVIEVGDLTTKRDYTDVRDVVKAYADLIEASSVSGLYNVCSGRSTSGKRILEMLLALTNIDDVQIKVDPAKIRPSDPKELYGSNSKIATATEWQPEISLEETLADFVKYKENLLSEV
jgi:GDP-4-dehydro-6-deoxy-D-mannose reductase